MSSVRFASASSSTAYRKADEGAVRGTRTLSGSRIEWDGRANDTVHRQADSVRSPSRRSVPTKSLGDDFRIPIHYSQDSNPFHLTEKRQTSLPFGAVASRHGVSAVNSTSRLTPIEGTCGSLESRCNGHTGIVHPVHSYI
ncbi:hypothetical protein LSAT2_029281 [Lamellibrachia satsuma]|nr:hypothetical protein LSAT2_029281 [Lamellibrachia satsuma]